MHRYVQMGKESTRQRAESSQRLESKGQDKNFRVLEKEQRLHRLWVVSSSVK